MPGGIVCSPKIRKYFDEIDSKVRQAYELANQARAQGFDPEKKADILLAESVGKRVEGIIAALEPKIIDSGVAERITELENKYGAGDWRVGLEIAWEVTSGRFFQIDNEENAIGIGIRAGLAYTTNGVVSAPLEGLAEIKLRDRLDGAGKYISIYFAGPIRGAGATQEIVALIIADYVRVKKGIAKYDPTPDEISRYYTEMCDYYERVERKQYKPAKEEIDFIIPNIAVEINGDPTAELEVSNYKNLPRVETNRIRGGLALVLTDGVVKLPKIWKQISKWGKDFGLDWEWLSNYLKLKKKIHSTHVSSSESDEEHKITPNYYYISEIVAGRPVFGYPLETGGFRLRYGRSRLTGDGSWAVSPVSARVLLDFLATGTQLRTERPGKSTALTMCDSIEGPIIKLEDGSVVRVESEEQAKKLKHKIKEILFVGDILISHGDFAEQGTTLVPPGYCEEWWLLEVEKAEKELGVKLEQIIDEDLAQKIKKDVFHTIPDFEQALKISMKLKVPFHPHWTLHWQDISENEFNNLVDWYQSKDYQINNPAKRTLEILGCPHKVREGKVAFEDSLKKVLDFFLKQKAEGKNGLECVNSCSPVRQRDKTGTAIGVRMGRPEKAKLRQLKGTPHILFPVGEEGGRLRSFAAAAENGKVTAQFPIFFCEKCNSQTIYPRCDICGSETQEFRICPLCKKKTKLEKCHRETQKYERTTLDINKYIRSASNLINMSQKPTLIKGVRGTSNKDHLMEYFGKGLLRANNNLNVNKDGTIRFDMTELGITHFKPEEIGLSIAKAKELGYEKDIHGNELASDEQLIEIFPQDVVMPACPDSADEGSDKVFVRVANFIDEELKKIYKQKPFYNVKTREDLIGHFVIGLSPHTSAGIVGRIIGFSETQGGFAHPYWHDAQRRDLDGEETSVFLLMDGFLNFSRQYLPDRRGGRSVSADTLLFYEEAGKIKIEKIGRLIDKLFEKEGFVIEENCQILRTQKNIKAISFDTKTKKVSFQPITSFIRHPANKQMFKIKTTHGEITTTGDHSIFVTEGKKIVSKRADELTEGEFAVVLNKIDLEQKNENINVNVLELLPSDKIYVEDKHSKLRRAYKSFDAAKKRKLNEKHGSSNISRWINGKRAAPYSIYKEFDVRLSDCKMRLQKGKPMKNKFKLSNAFFTFLGYLISEGHFVKNHRCEITNSNKEYVNEIASSIYELTGISPKTKIDYHRKNPYYRIYVPTILKEVTCALGVKVGKSHYKEIPQIVFNATKRNKLAFIKAYVNGDGHKYKGNTKIYTNSKKLAAGLSLLLHSLNYKTSCYLFKGKRNVYEILFSKLNNTDPFWPAQDYISELRKELRKKGFNKQEIHKVIGNYYAKTRTRTASIKAFEKFSKLVNNSVLKKQFSEILNSDIKVERIRKIEQAEYKGKYVYDIEVPRFQNFLCGPHPLFAHNSMDAPLVLSTKLNVEEIDDEVFDVDTVWKYPLEFYQAAVEMKNPWDVKIEQIKNRVGKPEQYEGLGFTHPVSNMNIGVRNSAYKSIPTMIEKMEGQLELAAKIRAVSLDKVAQLIIEGHFVRDIKGNLRKFTMQTYRCTACNTIYRRIPLSGTCSNCNKGNLVFTIAEGTIKKYLEATLKLITYPGMSPFIKQAIELLSARIESIFGRDKTKQIGLSEFC